MAITAETRPSIICSLVQRLDANKLSETKRRALESLMFKLSHSIISPADFKDDASLIGIVAAVTREEECDIRAMALEILDITTDNQLVAATVSALLSKSQLEDLISCSPVLLQHAFKKLHGKLFQKGLHGSRLSDQAASVTPVLPGTAVGPASETETEASRAHSVMPPLITAEQNTCLTVVPDPPCMPAPDTSPLFHNTYELQYADGSITGDASVHASLSIPAISPSMLFSVPPPTMADVRCHDDPSAPNTDVDPDPIQGTAMTSTAGIVGSLDCTEVHRHDGQPPWRIADNCTLGVAPHAAVMQSSDLRLKLKSKAASVILGGRDTAPRQTTYMPTQPSRSLAYSHHQAMASVALTQGPHRVFCTGNGQECDQNTQGGAPQTAKPQLTGAVCALAPGAIDSSKHLVTPALWDNSRRGLEPDGSQGVQTSPLDSVLAQQSRRPVRFAEEVSLEAMCAVDMRLGSTVQPQTPLLTTADGEVSIAVKVAEPVAAESVDSHTKLGHLGVCRSPGEQTLTLKETACVLPGMQLCQSDDQHLFELTVRLHHTESEHDALAVLQQLAMCTAEDFPVESLLQRGDMLDGVLEVMCSPFTPTLCCIWAVRFVHTLVLKTKQALLQSHNTELTPLYNAFEGPESAVGQLNAEEEALLHSYPQPCGPGALPDWLPHSEETIDIISCSHVIFSHAVIMLQRSNEVTPLVFSLLEELWPLLFLGRGMSGMQSSCDQISEYLTPLSEALEAQIFEDSKCDSDPSCRASESYNAIVPVLGCSAVHILSLIMRLIACVPVENARKVVPLELGERLGQLWCNPCMDILIPGWRSCLRPYLGQLAPASERAASLASLATDSIDQADALLHAAACGRSGEVPPPQWLQSVPQALLAIAFGSHKDMLQAVVEAIALTHRASREHQLKCCSEWVPPTVTALVAALHHPISGISVAAWSTVCQHLQGADRGLQSALLELMTHPKALTATFRLIVEDDIGHIKPAAAFVISKILTDGTANTKQAILPWVPWLDCYATDPVLCQACAQADALLLPLATNSAVGEAGAMWAWPQLCILLQRLYSKTYGTRRAAAVQLLSLVGGQGILNDQQVEEDPFHGLLDSSSSTVVITDAENHVEVEQMLVTDVHNIMACACNTGLPPSVRCSALQRLTTISQNSRCLAAMAVPSFLMDCFQCSEQSVIMASCQDEDQEFVGNVSICTTQLTAAALVLLGNLCCQSKAVLEWAMKHTDRMLKSVLPLMFHPLTMVRRAVAVFLAPLLFLPAMWLIQPDFLPPQSHVKRTASLPLTATFQGNYYVPFPVTEVSLSSAPLDTGPMPLGGNDSSMIAELLGEEGQSKLHMVQLLVSLGRLKERTVSNRNSAGQSNMTGSNCAVQTQQGQIKRCAEILEAADDTSLPPEAAWTFAASLKLNLVQERAQGYWNGLKGHCPDEVTRSLSAELCKMALSKSHTALIVEADGAIACLRAAFTNPPPQAPGMTTLQIWLHLCRHLLLSCAMKGKAVTDVLSFLVPAAVNMLARWCPGSNRSKAQPTDRCSHEELLHEAALPTQHEHKQVQPAVTSILEVVALALQQSRLRCSIEDRVACAQLLAAVDFVGLLLNSILANSHARPECRYAAAACLREVTSLCGLLRASVPALSAAPAGRRGGACANECCSALHELDPSLCLLLQHIVRQVGMPAQNSQSTSVAGRQMLRLGLHMLTTICQALPPERWSSAWANAVGVFWLTRLLRHQDVHVRCSTAHLLATLVHPAAGQMRSVLLRAWPEGGTVMMRHGLSRRQPPAFAAAALCFTAASMATSSTEVPKSGHDAASKALSESVSDFGCEAVLAREFFWEGLLARMPACGQAPTLAAATCTLLCVRATCMPVEFPGFLRSHGQSLEMLTQQLDIQKHLTPWMPPEWRSLQCDAHCGPGFANTLNPGSVSLRDVCMDDSGQVGPVQTQSSTRTASIEHVADAAAADSCSVQHSLSSAAAITSGVRLLCCLGCPFTLPAIQAAGNAAAVLQVAVCQAVANGEATAVPDSALPAVLAAVATLCPAAGCMFECHKTDRSQAHSTAASSAAAQCCRCATALLQIRQVSAGELKVALACAKAHAEVDVAVALACALRKGGLVLPTLRAEASNLLAALLAEPEAAEPVLCSWVDEGEWKCLWPQPADMHGTQMAPECNAAPIGSALLDGLMPQCSDSQSRQVLGSLSLQDNGIMERTGAAEQSGSGMLCVHWTAVQRLLAHSSEAKDRAIMRELHLHWEQRAVQAMDSLGKDQDQMQRSNGAKHSCEVRADGEKTMLLHQWLKLLRHLAYRSASAKAAVSRTELLPALQRCWKNLLNVPTCLHEALLLVSVLVSDSFDARHALSSGGEPSLLVLFVRDFLRGGARTARQAAACQLLCNYAGSLDGTLALMKSPFLTEATPALQSALLRSEDVTASQIIRVCSAMASHSIGQRQLLRTPGAPAFVDVVGEYGGHPRLQLSFTAMLELLRNLAFLHDNKPYYLADPRVLNLLAQLVKNAQNDWDRAALALSTVWALLHKGERVKATLKGLPDFMSAMRSCSEVVENLTQQHNMSKCTVNVHVVKQLEQSSRVVARVLDL